MIHQDGLFNRRDILRVGSLSVAASALPVSIADAAATGRGGKAKSVIYLWMGGGVTHIDSYDPKPDAPEEIRGTLEPIATTIPGVQFTEVNDLQQRCLRQFLFRGTADQKQLPRTWRNLFGRGPIRQPPQ